jgi:hypothetical protein
MGPQGWSGRVRKIAPPTGSRSQDRLARSMVAIPAALSERVAWKTDGKRHVYVTLHARRLEGGQFGRASEADDIKMGIGF